MKRSIVYIANKRIPTDRAYGVQVVHMCDAFSQSGADVRLIIPKKNTVDSSYETIAQTYGIKNKFTVQALTILNPTFLAAYGKGLYYRMTLVFFGMKLLNVIRAIPKDAVFYTRDELLLPLLLKYSKNVYWEAHQIPRRINKYSSWISQCAGIICISEGIEALLKNAELGSVPMIVAHDGVSGNFFSSNTNKAELRKELGLPNNKKLAVYVGGLFERKGARTLAEAALSSNSNVSAVFVGGTEQAVNSFKSTYTGDTIHILGHKPYDQVVKYMHAADVLVLPNSARDTDSRELTSPMKLFEYMATGVPIVASDVPAIRRVLDDSMVTFCKPDDKEDLNRAIDAVFADNVNSLKKAENAIMNAKKYTWRSRAELILNFISNSLQ